MLWEKRIPDSEDAFGNPEFDPGVNIQVRLVRRNRTFDTGPGGIVVTTRSLLVKDDVATGDRITCDDGESFVIQIGPSEVRWITGEWWGAFVHG